MTTMTDRDVIAWARGIIATCPDGTEMAVKLRRLADLAEKGAEPTARNMYTDPRQGDMFIDPEGDIVEVTSTPRFIPHVYRTDKRVTTPGPQTVEEFERWIRGAGCRPMTAEEVEAFRRDGTRPPSAPPGGGR
jgi:hypothetical protein